MNSVVDPHTTGRPRRRGLTNTKVLRVLALRGPQNLWRLGREANLGYSTVQYVCVSLLRKGYVRPVATKNRGASGQRIIDYDITEKGLWACLCGGIETPEIRNIAEHSKGTLHLLLDKWEYFRNHGVEHLTLDILKNINPHQREVHLPLAKASVVIPTPDDHVQVFYLIAYQEYHRSWGPADREKWDAMVASDPAIADFWRKIKEVDRTEQSVQSEVRDRLERVKLAEKIVLLRFRRID